MAFGLSLSSHRGLIKQLVQSLSRVTAVAGVALVLGVMAYSVLNGPTDSFAANQDRDIRVNSSIPSGIYSYSNGDTVTYQAQVTNVATNGSAGEDASRVIIREFLPSGVTFTGEWGDNAGLTNHSERPTIAIVNDPSGTHQNGSVSATLTSNPGYIEWEIVNLNVGVEYEFRYSVDITASSGTLKNYTEAYVDETQPGFTPTTLEFSPYFNASSSECSPGPTNARVDPRNTNEYSVEDPGNPGTFTNNADCDEFTVLTTVNGACGADHQQAFYTGSTLTNLCDTGTASQVQFSSTVGWSWDCIGNTLGTTANCQAAELFCGDTEVNGPEECDDQVAGEDDGCTTSCEFVIPACSTADSFFEAIAGDWQTTVDLTTSHDSYPVTITDATTQNAPYSTTGGATPTTYLNTGSVENVGFTARIENPLTASVFNECVFDTGFNEGQLTRISIPMADVSILPNATEVMVINVDYTNQTSTPIEITQIEIEPVVSVGLFTDYVTDIEVWRDNGTQLERIGSYQTVAPTSQPRTYYSVDLIDDSMILPSNSTDTLYVTYSFDTTSASAGVTVDTTFANDTVLLLDTDESVRGTLCDIATSSQSPTCIPNGTATYTSRTITLSSFGSLLLNMNNINTTAPGLVVDMTYLAGEPTPARIATIDLSADSQAFNVQGVSIELFGPNSTDFVAQALDLYVYDENDVLIGSYQPTAMNGSIIEYNTFTYTVEEGTETLYFGFEFNPIGDNELGTILEDVSMTVDFIQATGSSSGTQVGRIEGAGVSNLTSIIPVVLDGISYSLSYGSNTIPNPESGGYDKLISIIRFTGRTGNNTDRLDGSDLEVELDSMIASVSTTGNVGDVFTNFELRRLDTPTSSFTPILGTVISPGVNNQTIEFDMNSVPRIETLLDDGEEAVYGMYATIDNNESFTYTTSLSVNISGSDGNEIYEIETTLEQLLFDLLLDLEGVVRSVVNTVTLPEIILQSSNAIQNQFSQSTQYDEGYYTYTNTIFDESGPTTNLVTTYQLDPNLGCLWAMYQAGGQHIDLQYSDDGGTIYQSYTNRANGVTGGAHCVQATHAKFVHAPTQGISERHNVTIVQYSTDPADDEYCTDIVVSADDAQYVEATECVGIPIIPSSTSNGGGGSASSISSLSSVVTSGTPSIDPDANVVTPTNVEGMSPEQVQAQIEAAKRGTTRVEISGKEFDMSLKAILMVAMTIPEERSQLAEKVRTGEPVIMHGSGNTQSTQDSPFVSVEPQSRKEMLKQYLEMLRSQ